MNKSDALRSLPSVHEFLATPELAEMREEIPSPILTQWVRESVDACRRAILDSGEDETLGPASDEVAAQVRDRYREHRGIAIQRVINATGIVLHTNLGRAPLSESAVRRVISATGYSNVELDLSNGKRSKRGQRIADLLCQLTGTEDALVVNNCAAATMLVLQAFAAQKEVIISRGQLVEIGGGFRLPDVFRSAGAELREVGTTNRSYVRDYEAAINESTGAVLRVHHSNFRMTGFVTEPTIRELVAIQRPEDVPVIDDLGSGWLGDDLAMLASEPSVPDSVAAGADLTLFSGDKLLGGPQCGIVIGKKRFIDRLRRNPLMRAMRVDKMTIAAMEATIEIHLAGNAEQEVPAIAMLKTSSEVIQERCRRVIDLLNTSVRDRVDAIACRSEVGGGSVPGRDLASFGLRIESPRPDAMAQALRDGTPAVQARVHEDALLLDLRTVSDSECKELAERLQVVLQHHGGSGRS